MERIVSARTPVAILAIVSLALAARAAGKSDSAGEAPPDPPKQPAESIEQDVRRSVFLLPDYGAHDHIGWKIEGGVVTLDGITASASLKESAGRVIGDTRGVEKVVNRIQVVPATAVDRELEEAVFRAVFDNTDMVGYAVRAVPAIRVVARNGAVTLFGVVAKPDHKTWAATEAAKVKGVKSVDDRLAVSSEREGDAFVSP